MAQAEDKPAPFIGIPIELPDRPPTARERREAELGIVNEWNQRMTVEVETPWGLRTGTAVHGVQWVDFEHLPRLPDMVQSSQRSRGDALVVDVRPDAPKGEPRYLIAKVRAISHAPRWFFLTRKEIRRQTASEQAEVILASRGPARLDEWAHRYQPSFVTFDDIDDPATLRKIDPRDLSAVFGEGVRIKDIWLEITDDPVRTTEIREILPAIAAGASGRLTEWEGIGDYRPAAHTNYSEFSNINLEID